MKAKSRLIQASLVLVVSVAVTSAFAVDKTNEGAKSEKASSTHGEKTKTSKDGVTVHEVSNAEKMDRDRREAREKEKAGKKK